MRIEKYPCVYMRGGTSKAVVFHRKDLPKDEAEWPEIFLGVMGSPDVKQIDGMGGAVSSTSKIAVIGPTSRADAHVDYTFYQVDIGIPNVDASINCGNISSAVGPFAIDEGLVPATEPITTVRVHNVNTGKIIEEHIKVKDGRAMVEGDEEIKGVPGTGSRIDMYFEKPCGAKTGRTFPTGKRKDIFDVPDYGPIEVSLVDCSNPVVFIRASDVGLKGTELVELNARADIMEHLERIRGMAAEKMGLVKTWSDARKLSTSAPKIAFVALPHDYTAIDGKAVKAETMDLCCRAISLGVVHKAYPMTLAVCTACAAKFEGTVVHELVSGTIHGDAIRLGHVGGVTQVSVKMNGEDDVSMAGIVRTARRIMDGHIYIRRP